jgi:tripartite-type tricarboxylate transporter receptor subunit TctC
MFRGVAATAFAAALPALAQDAYPVRPVKIIAPQAPGGGVDLVARIIADKLRIATGQSRRCPCSVRVEAASSASAA